MPQPKLQVWQIQKWQKLKNNLVVAFPHALKSILKSDQNPRYMIPVKWKRQSRYFWQIFKLCNKMPQNFCVANITMPTSFHQCLGVKPCFETKFCQKFSYKIYVSVLWKVVAQSTTFVIYCGWQKTWV